MLLLIFIPQQKQPTALLDRNSAETYSKRDGFIGAIPFFILCYEIIRTVRFVGYFRFAIICLVASHKGSCRVFNIVNLSNMFGSSSSVFRKVLPKTCLNSVPILNFDTKPLRASLRLTLCGIPEPP